MSNPIAIVVGAGPAGLSASIGLSRAGYKVEVFEQRPQWQGRVCGAFLNPEAVAHLDWLGVLGAVRKESVVVSSSEVTFGGKKYSVPIGQSHRAALGLPRQRLEEILWDEAIRVGVEIKVGQRFPKEKSGATGSLVVSADGRFSNGVSKKSSGWFGWNATFSNVRQKPGEMSLHYYPKGYVGVLTFLNGQTNVCGLLHRENPSPLHWEEVFSKALEASSAFQNQMIGSQRVGDWRGVGPLPFSRGFVESGDCLPVGDAAAVGDPFMGEGNGRALGAGPMIYASVKEGGLLINQYRKIWQEAYSSRFRLGFWTRALMEHPVLFSFVAQGALRLPWLINRATPHFHAGFLVKVDALNGGI